MSNSPNWLLYGATGYTGRLIAREAAKRGLRPTLAGRSAEKLAALAEELSLPWRVLSLDDPTSLASALREFRAVLHCAGPFSQTAAPMMQACLDARCHYLDITGEIDVIELAATLGPRAQEVGVTLLPAVGFDVVPSDCLALALAEVCPQPESLTLAFTGTGGFSPGTAKTMLESLPYGPRARMAGHIERVPHAERERVIPFTIGNRTAQAVPWGDVASAYYTTGCPNITTYVALAPAEAKQMRSLAWLAPLLRFAPALRWLQGQVERHIPGPTPDELAASRSWFWGEMIDAQGRRVTGTLATLGGYSLTALTSLACLERVLAGDAPTGFTTPARAFGAKFIEQFPETQLVIHQ